MRCDAFILLIAIVACTEPNDRQLSPIEDIDVPAVRAAGETLDFSFRYSWGGCESDGGVTVTKIPGGLSITAFKIVPDPHRGLNCPDVLRLKTMTHLVPPAERGDPFTLTFRQPSGVDSIRVVRTQ